MDKELRDKFMAGNDLKLEEVIIPEYGNLKLWVKVMSGAEKDSLDAKLTKIKAGEVVMNRENIHAEIVVRTLCDEKGHRLFSDAEAAEVGKKMWTALERIAVVANRLNGYDKEAKEEAIKNSK